MLDPREGVDPDGCIRTGAHRSRVPAPYEEVLAALTSAVAQASTRMPVSVYVYGSVATGTAQVPTSDVDVVTIGLGASDAAAVSARLSEQFAHLCRAVEIATAQPDDHTGDTDAVYGSRAFLRHYCLHLAGPDVTAGWPAFPADVRAARGFNGDLAVHHRRWLADLAVIRRRDADGEPVDAPTQALARRVARKTLLAAAGLVSVRHRTWTTDRATAARQLAEDQPPLAAGLAELAAWCSSVATVRPADVGRTLGPGGVVRRVVDAFAGEVGLWRDPGVPREP